MFSWCSGRGDRFGGDAREKQKFSSGPAVDAAHLEIKNRWALAETDCSIYIRRNGIRLLSASSLHFRFPEFHACAIPSW